MNFVNESDMFTLIRGALHKNTYGITLRFGYSSFDNFVSDTYYISISYDGDISIGTQLNGASKALWYNK